MAKVFERIIYDQLYQYLNENDLLSRHQSGFRSLHSTVTALIEVTDNWPWSLNIDRGFINAVVFLDLKKAFHTVDHTISSSFEIASLWYSGFHKPMVLLLFKKPNSNVLSKRE